ncbi:multicopper oxidase family protein, partial [Burkholderia sp. SIMBA_051]
MGNIIDNFRRTRYARRGSAPRFTLFHALLCAAVVALLYCINAHAAAPGITGTNFDLSAEANRI